MGGPCDFSASPSPFGLDFGTLGLWDFGLGLVNFFTNFANISARLFILGTFNKLSSTLV